MPVIAAVHGHALGGGLQIALGADIRIVHPDTQAVGPRGPLGPRAGHDRHVVPVPPRPARRGQGADVHGRIFDGREAASLGLVTRLSDDPLAEAIGLAAEIALRTPRRSAAQAAVQSPRQRGRRRAVRRGAPGDHRRHRDADQSRP